MEGKLRWRAAIFDAGHRPAIGAELPNGLRHATRVRSFRDADRWSAMAEVRSAIAERAQSYGPN